MSKQLITAEIVRSYKQQGQGSITNDPKLCIITPEAREVARELGVEIVESNASAVGACKVASPACDSSKKISDADFNLIRNAVLQNMPEGAKISDDLLAQLVAKAVKESNCANSTQQRTKIEKSQTVKSGIKLVKGNAVKLGLFDGADASMNISIADVITAQDNSSMAAGFLSWENAFFPWTLNYDEVQVVLEGELHITSNGETVIGRPGDVIFVPKGTAIEFGSPTKVRFVYIAWPANWQEQS